MKVTFAGIFAALVLFNLGGCSSPPKPPHCDGSDRHPINSVRQSSADVAPVDHCSRG